MTEGHDAIFSMSREMECLARPPTFYMIQTSLKNIKKGTCQRGVAQSYAKFYRAAHLPHALFSLGLCSVTRRVH